MTAIVAALIFGGPPTPIAEIPFELWKNQIWLKATLDGKSLRVMLDTGAGDSVMDEKVALGAGVVKGRRKEFFGVGGGTEWGWNSKGRDLRLSGSSIDTPVFDILPLAELSPDAAHPVHAILGYDFFRAYVVQIDYLAKTIRVFPSEGYAPPSGFESLSFQFIDRAPTVDGALRLPGLAELPATVQFDTGSAFGIDVAHRTVRRHKLDRRFPNHPNSECSGGVGGSVLSRAIGLAEGRLGSTTVSGSTRLILSGSPTVKRPLGFTYDYDVSLGNDALSRLDLIFDYSRHRIYLKSIAK